MTAQLSTPAAGTTVPVAPAPPARLAAGLAVLVALAGGVLGPMGQLDVLLGPDAITVAAGTVEVQVDEDWQPLPVGAQVRPGTTVRTPDGTATLNVPGGAVDVAEGSLVTADEQLAVTAGTLVVRSPRAVVTDGATVAEGTDTWRFDATGRISAYAGSAVMTDAAGREVLVRSLQETRVREGVLAVEPRPYAYADADAFDRQYLATAFEVDDHLAALSQGLAAEYGTAPQVEAFYTDFEGLDRSRVTALRDVGFERVGDRVGPPADVLVASVVTDALVVDAGLADEVAAAEVRDQRVAGATWGLIVLDHDLDTSHVRAAAERALTRRQLAEQQGTAVPVSAPATPSDAPAAAAPGADPTDVTDPGGSPSDPDDGDPDPDDPAPPPDEDPDDDRGPVGTVVEESGADELLDDELGGLVDDVVDTTDDLIDDVASTTDGLVGGLAPTSSTGDDGGIVGDTVDTVEGTIDTLLGD